MDEMLAVIVVDRFGARDLGLAVAEAIGRGALSAIFVAHVLGRPGPVDGAAPTRPPRPTGSRLAASANLKRTDRTKVRGVDKKVGAPSSRSPAD